MHFARPTGTTQLTKALNVHPVCCVYVCFVLYVRVVCTCCVCCMCVVLYVHVVCVLCVYVKNLLSYFTHCRTKMAATSHYPRPRYSSPEETIEELKRRNKVCKSHGVM